jgi:hypothetical protein
MFAFHHISDISEDSPGHRHAQRMQIALLYEQHKSGDASACKRMFSAA